MKEFEKNLEKSTVQKNSHSYSKNAEISSYENFLNALNTLSELSKNIAEMKSSIDNIGSGSNSNENKFTSSKLEETLENINKRLLEASSYKLNTTVKKRGRKPKNCNIDQNKSLTIDKNTSSKLNDISGNNKFGKKEYKSDDNNYSHCIEHIEKPIEMLARNNIEDVSDGSLNEHYLYKDGNNQTPQDQDALNDFNANNQCKKDDLLHKKKDRAKIDLYNGSTNNNQLLQKKRSRKPCINNVYSSFIKTLQLGKRKQDELEDRIMKMHSKNLQLIAQNKVLLKDTNKKLEYTKKLENLFMIIMDYYMNNKPNQLSSHSRNYLLPNSQNRDLNGQVSQSFNSYDLNAAGTGKLSKQSERKMKLMRNNLRKNSEDIRDFNGLDFPNAVNVPLERKENAFKDWMYKLNGVFDSNNGTHTPQSTSWDKNHSSAYNNYLMLNNEEPRSPNINNFLTQKNGCNFYSNTNSPKLHFFGESNSTINNPGTVVTGDEMNLESPDLRNQFCYDQEADHSAVFLNDSIDLMKASGNDTLNNGSKLSNELESVGGKLFDFTHDDNINEIIESNSIVKDDYTDLGLFEKEEY
eukprot:CAMPEP_0170534154 /NCGR_PEP_ID=MMETSP0209-20121228/88894_1 /TAXON_ID=665100 ORGANISM="Litonotus pictus, Strain P1" /NCGR_SAMPLE_ID=MMETSP0209 /ASSEMBLY_ACC=CAM_ASM_000301 /LENGTH=578 /DNA_ID=CAMNT_0010833101 /DNA_START=638 /DNA_END=2371 /DNA_ORIENTATION=+